MITLRPLTDADAPAIHRVYSGATVTFLGRPGVEQYVLGVEAAGGLIGVVKLGRRPADHGRVSYVLREDCWGKGYATRAVKELAAFAFTTAGLDSLGAKHHPDNPASGRVLAKAGFTRLGTQDGMIEYQLAENMWSAQRFVTHTTTGTSRIRPQEARERSAAEASAAGSRPAPRP